MVSVWWINDFFRAHIFSSGMWKTSYRKRAFVWTGINHQIVVNVYLNYQDFFTLCIENAIALSLHVFVHISCVMENIFIIDNFRPIMCNFICAIMCHYRVTVGQQVCLLFYGQIKSVPCFSHNVKLFFLFSYVYHMYIISWHAVWLLPFILVPVYC